MNELPYLIAHKVRGEPAFDIAHQMEVGDQIWWIVSTSGHRAYPFWVRPLDSFDINNGYNMPEMPADLRDHYQAFQGKPAIDDIDLEELGLL